MAEIKDLSLILESLKIEISNKEYVFCTVENLKRIDIERCFAVINEQEGFTVITEKVHTSEINENCICGFKRITINIHTSLDSVGLTALISGELAKNKISANIIAGYYHDHIFVRSEVADKARNIICNLKGKNC